MQHLGEDLSSAKVLSELLARHVGHGREACVKRLAHDCGCSIETIYNARKGAPVGFDVAGRIINELPPAAKVEFIQCVYGVTVTSLQGNAPGCHHEVGRELALGTSDYVQAASDGDINDTESRQLMRRYSRIQAVLARLAAGAATAKARL